MASQIDDNNLRISDWVWDFLLKRASLDDQALNSLITILPIPKTNPSFPKFLLLRKLQSYVSHSSFPESALDLLEHLQAIDGLVASNAIKRAYCAVAVDCTLKHWDVEFEYFECVKRVWRKRIGEMEKLLGKGGGLGSDELWEWKEQIEVAAWDNDVRKTLFDKSKGVVNAVEMVTGYLTEERGKMGPTFLEMLSDTIKGDVVIKEMLGLGEDGVVASVHVGLDRKEVDRGNTIKGDGVIKEKLSLGKGGVATSVHVGLDRKKGDRVNTSKSDGVITDNLGLGKVGVAASVHVGLDRKKGDGGNTVEGDGVITDKLGLGKVGVAASLHVGLDRKKGDGVNTVKGDGVINEKLGLGKVGVAASLHVGLDRKKGDRVNTIKGDCVINEKLGLGKRVASLNVGLDRKKGDGGNTIKGDGVIKEKLGLGEGGVGSVHVGLDRKQGDRGNEGRKERIKDDIVIKEKLRLGSAHGDVGDESDRVCMEGKHSNGNDGRKEEIQLRKGHRRRRGIHITDCDDEMDVGPSNAIDSDIPSMLRARNLMKSIESYDIRVAEAIRKRARVENRIENRIQSKVVNVDRYGVVHHTPSTVSNSVRDTFEETNALPNTSHKHLPSKRRKLGSSFSAKTGESLSDVNKMQGKNVEETDAPSQENWPVNRDKLGLPRPRQLQAPISVQDLESLKVKPKRRWNSVEEDTLRNGVHKFGEGNWKMILMAYGDVFEGRTNVDLKDKWRNMLRAGRS